MSAPSGIKVPADIASSFTSAQSSGDAVRALVWVIEGESFKLHGTINRQSTFKEDIELLPKSLPNAKTPASFAYRLDSKNGSRYEWMMITFVPDDAGVRAKMLQASSRGGLMKALGAANFKHDWFATSLKDLTPSALTSHLNHLSSPAPLSAAEKALAEVREAEAEEAKRAALDPQNEARRKQAVTGLGAAMKLQEGVQEALVKVGQRSDDGWVVVLEIPANNTSALSLHTSEACTPSQLASKVPAKNPSYTFYSFPTPAPAPSAATPAKTWKSSTAGTVTGNNFHASEGGKRFVTTTWTKSTDETNANASTTTDQAKTEETKSGEVGEKKDGEEEADVNKLSISTDAEGGDGKEEEAKEVAASPEQEKANPVVQSPTASTKEVKGRVIFIYSCPSSSPVKFRMIYSTSVRGVQQDAINLGVEIIGKEETSDPSDLTESLLRSALPSSSFQPSTQASSGVGLPKHASSLPTPGSANISSSPSFGAPKPAFGAPAPAFGGAFGRPRPVVKKVESYSSTTSASQIPLPASAGPGTPISPANNTEAEGDDSKERIKSAFDAFGPRVGAGGGGGFARPRPAARR